MLLLLLFFLVGWLAGIIILQYSTVQHSIVLLLHDAMMTDWLTDDIENRKDYINFYYLCLSAFFILYCYWGLLYCTVFVIISQCHDVMNRPCFIISSKKL
jgi:hypothetical protein